MKFLLIISTSNHLNFIRNFEKKNKYLRILDLRKLNDPLNFHKFPLVTLESELIFPPITFKKPAWGPNRQNYFITIWKIIIYLKPWVSSLLIKEKPDICILQSDSGMLERLIIHLCKQNSVKTVFIQDGLFVTCAPNLDLLRWYEGVHLKLRIYFREQARVFLAFFSLDYLASVLYGHGTTDISWYWSRYQNLVIKNSIFPPKNTMTKIIGYTRTPEKIKKIHFKGATKNIKICYFGSGDLGDLIEIEKNHIKILNELANKYSGISIYIRPHPQTNPDIYAAIIKKNQRIKIIKDKEISSLSILKSIDLCITTISSVYFESVEVGTPVLIIKIGFKSSINRIYLPTHPGLIYFEKEFELDYFIAKITRNRLKAIANFQKYFFKEENNLKKSLF